MSTLSLRIPDSYHTAVKAIASTDNVSINQFIVSAVAEKIAAYETQSYLEKRAERASRDTFMGVLAKVPPAEPDGTDR